MLAESHFLCRDEAWLGRRRSTRRPGGFGPLSPLGLHSAWISFCIFVCFLCCLVIFHSSPRPSCFLTFYLSGFSAHEKLRHWTRPLVQLSFGKQWPDISLWRPITGSYFSPDWSRCTVLAALAEQKLLPDEMWLTCWHTGLTTPPPRSCLVRIFIFKI